MNAAVHGATESIAVEPLPAWTLDGDDVAKRLCAAGLDIDRARPVYLRDKPGQTLVVGYELMHGATVERGYLRWCSDQRRAADDRRKAYAIAPSSTALGPGVVDVDDHATVRILPNDARLRRARWYLTPRKVKRTLADLDHGGRTLSGSATSVTVLTYKPERRVVARVDLGYRDGHRTTVLMRYTTRSNASALASLAEHLRRNGVATARPIAQLERGAVGIDEFLTGVDLRTAAGSAPNAQIAEVVADQIAALHRTAPPPGVESRHRDHDLATALESLAWLSVRRFADRGLAATVGRALVAASKGAAVAPAVLVHGDLHDRNVLVDTAGRPSAAVIDLERVAVGEATLDLGRLLAAGITGCILGRAASTDLAVFGRIVDGVIARGDHVVDDPAALAFHVATAMVATALTGARDVETIADPSLVDRMLGAALDVIRDPDLLGALGDAHRWSTPGPSVATASSTTTTTTTHHPHPAVR